MFNCINTDDLIYNHLSHFPVIFFMMFAIIVPGVRACLIINIKMIIIKTISFL